MKIESRENRRVIKTNQVMVAVEEKEMAIFEMAACVII